MSVSEAPAGTDIADEAKSCPPLWQYSTEKSSGVGQAFELICAPKGVGPSVRSEFLLQSGNF
jgi:hypothetical protein